MQKPLSFSTGTQDITAPWDIRGVEVANGTDVVLSLNDDRGNTYVAQPAQPIAFGIPAGTQVIHATFLQQPHVGSASLTLHNELIPTTTYPPTVAPGGQKMHTQYNYPHGTGGGATERYDVSGATLAVVSFELLTADGSAYAPASAGFIRYGVGAQVNDGSAPLINVPAYTWEDTSIAGPFGVVTHWFGPGGDAPILDYIVLVIIDDPPVDTSLRVIIVTMVGGG